MNGARILAVVFFGMGIVLVFFTPSAALTETLGDPGPAVLPRIVGVCTGLLAVLLWVHNPQPQQAAEAATESPGVIVLSLMAIPIFYIMFQHLGYTIATTVYLLTAFWLLGVRHAANGIRYALAATAFSLASGMVFARWLELPLPGVMP